MAKQTAKRITGGKKIRFKVNAPLRKQRDHHTRSLVGRARVNSSCFFGGEQAIEKEKKHSAENRHDESRGLPFLVPTNQATQIAGDKGAGESEKHGDYPTARNLAGRQQFGNRTNDKANECGQRRLNMGVGTSNGEFG